MGAAEAAHADLMAALTAGSFSPIPQPGGSWAAPATLVQPGSPWLVPSTIGGGVTVTYEIHIVPGGLDDAGSWAELTRRVDRVLAIIAELDGWLVVNAGKPTGIITDDGARYLEAFVTVQALYSMEG